MQKKIKFFIVESETLICKVLFFLQERLKVIQKLFWNEINSIFTIKREKLFFLLRVTPSQGIFSVK